MPSHRLAFAALALLGCSVPAAAQKCRVIHNASDVGLWVVYDEKHTAVEGSVQSAEKRNDRVWGRLFFEVAVEAEKPKARCLKLGWRVEPAGDRPVDAFDFGGRLPSGIITLSNDSDHGGDPEGEIELWVPDDRVREADETFRIVLTDAVTGHTLPGLVGKRDEQSGVRDRKASATSLDMRHRLLMTVQDAPEQASRH